MKDARPIHELAAWLIEHTTAAGAFRHISVFTEQITLHVKAYRQVPMIALAIAAHLEGKLLEEPKPRSSSTHRWWDCTMRVAGVQLFIMSEHEPIAAAVAS